LNGAETDENRLLKMLLREVSLSLGGRVGLRAGQDAMVDRVSRRLRGTRLKPVDDVVAERIIALAECGVRSRTALHLYLAGRTFDPDLIQNMCWSLKNSNAPIRGPVKSALRPAGSFVGAYIGGRHIHRT
jgi:hypothetical protein